MNAHAPVQSAVPDEPQPARFSSDQFRAIAASGALDNHAKAELIDGRIIVANAQYMPHMRLKLLIYDMLRATIGRGGTLDVGMEGSVDLDGQNMPQPDLFVWELRHDAQAAPRDSIRLAIEVADASEAYDLGEKRKLYATHAIPEYWVVRMQARTIERFTDPTGADYRRHESFSYVEGVSSLILPDVALAGGALDAL